MLDVQVVRCSQPPVLLQLPLAPQAPEAAGWQVTGLVARAGVPPGMFEHRPALLVGWLQLWQPPAQGVLQQTPSAQKPLVHWPPAVHEAPSGFSPQELLTHVLGGKQSWASVAFVQPDLHAPSVQANTPQSWLAGVRQAPLPSQVEAGVADDGVAQSAGAQWSPCWK
jgi:hypothetical protein